MGDRLNERLVEWVASGAPFPIDLEEAALLVGYTPTSVSNLVKKLDDFEKGKDFEVQENGKYRISLHCAIMLFPDGRKEEVLPFKRGLLERLQAKYREDAPVCMPRDIGDDGRGNELIVTKVQDLVNCVTTNMQIVIARMHQLEVTNRELVQSQLTPALTKIAALELELKEGRDKREAAELNFQQYQAQCRNKVELAQIEQQGEVLKQRERREIEQARYQHTERMRLDPNHTPEDWLLLFLNEGKRRLTESGVWLAGDRELVVMQPGQIWYRMFEATSRIPTLDHGQAIDIGKFIITDVELLGKKYMKWRNSRMSSAFAFPDVKRFTDALTNLGYEVRLNYSQSEMMMGGAPKKRKGVPKHQYWAESQFRESKLGVVVGVGVYYLSMLAGLHHFDRHPPYSELCCDHQVVKGGAALPEEAEDCRKCARDYLVV